MKKVRILFLIPSLVGGGAERTLINLLNKLDYSKYHVDLLVVCKTGVYLKSVPKEVKVVYLTKSLLITRLFAYLQKIIKYDIYFKYILKRKKISFYDFGISYIDGNFTSLLFELKDVKRKISFVHGSYASNPNFYKFYRNAEYVKHLKEARYNRLDTICFVSRDCKDEFESIFGKYPKMYVLYNVINSEGLNILSNEYHVTRDEDFTFVAVGSLLPVKNYDLLIRSCNILKEKNIKFKLWILGVGPEMDKVKELIGLYNLFDFISLLGYKNNPYPYMLCADAFVMSSISEALPTVMCEAMLLGKPVVAARASGCNEILGDNEFGLLAEQNENSLAEKMSLLITNDDLCNYYSNQSLSRSNKFKDHVTVSEYIKLFDENITN